MRRDARLFIGAVGLAFLGALWVVLLSSPGRRGGPVDLRDSPGEIPAGSGPGGLAGRHADLFHSREACFYCHPASGRLALKARWGGGGSPGGFPSPTAICLSCHDGTVAGASGFNAVPGRRGAIDLSGSHPVGVDFRLAQLDKPSEYNDPSTHSGIRLEGGRVGCTSCHPAHDPAGRSNEAGWDPGSCQACHRK